MKWDLCWGYQTFNANCMLFFWGIMICRSKCIVLVGNMMTPGQAQSNRSIFDGEFSETVDVFDRLLGVKKGSCK